MLRATRLSCLLVGLIGLSHSVERNKTRGKDLHFSFPLILLNNVEKGEQRGVTVHVSSQYQTVVTSLGLNPFS